MKIERSKFFAAVRVALFGGTLYRGQVAGIEAILDEWGTRRLADPRHLAYMLATVYHEVARSMQPIREWGDARYFFRLYDIAGERPGTARHLGNVEPGDGVRFCGRGFVQLTGRRNYRRMTDLVTRPRFGLDLVAEPDAALRLDVATAILFEGMLDAESGFGDFTGLALDDFFDATKDDPVGARRIINGLDRAELVAGYHRRFLVALQGAALQGAALRA